MKHTDLKHFIISIACIFVSSIIFIGLFFHDNKYTHAGLQPANGILYLSESELSSHSLRFLIRGWSFYPDRLLTPDDLPDNSDYMTYTAIGEHTHFDLDGRRSNPHGQGTYVLRIILPEKEASYSLMLPEIYSSYRLYVNDSPAIQVGNPSADSYSAKTQERTCTFTAGGTVTILIAVSDQTHFYSGMVYPPAFGYTYSVNFYRAMRMILSVIVVVLAAAVSLLSFYLGLRMKYRNACTFSALCLICAIFYASPVIHTIICLPVIPFSAITLAVTYAIPALVISLHNRICNVPSVYRICSACFSWTFCIISIIYALCSAVLTTPVIQLFSFVVFVYKLCAAAYLLITAFTCLRDTDTQVFPVFLSALVYSAGFVWELILPDYEPIYSDWFMGWCSLFYVLMIGYILWRDIVNAYAANFAFMEENRQMHRQLTMQTEYTRQLTLQAEENRRLTHDLKHHIHTLSTLAAQNGQQDILDYLQQINQTAIYSGMSSFCEDSIVDALLRYYYGMAQSNEIRISIHFSLPEHCPLNQIELCTILGNLLENAIEACTRQTSGSGNKKEITLNAKENGYMWMVSIENTYDGRLRCRGEKFISSKRTNDAVGIGIESVRKILKEHNSSLDIFPGDHLFRAGFLLPLQP